MALEPLVARPASLEGSSLPSRIRTRSGATFDPKADLWYYRDTVKQVSLDFGSFHALSDQMRLSLKRALIWYAENSSAAHLGNMFSRFLHLVNFIASQHGSLVNSITNTNLLSYKSSLHPQTDYYLGSLSGFLRKWHAMGLPGVTDEAVAVLKALRLKGNTKGEAVRTMDPRLGPFTSIELEQIQSAVNEAYANGAITDESYYLTWLYMALGQRSSQYAALKVSDVKATTVRGEIHYTINMPRLKQRTADPRQQMKERPLVSQIGKPLLEYANRLRKKFEGVIDKSDNVPLFPASSALADSMRDCTPGYEYHQVGSALGQNFASVLESLKVRSERTGEMLHITPLRFRRTFGTRAAQEGHGELVIAELLDHSDTQNVGVYVEYIPEIAARINRAMAMQIAPLAQAFKGMMIRNESEARRGNDPTSRIIDPRIDRSMRPVGSCGQHSFCGFNAPIACYTCQNFQPWLDGPHEAVLTHLLEKREQLLATTDQRMASVNDTTILAVAQVIQLCRDAKQDRNTRTDG